MMQWCGLDVLFEMGSFTGVYIYGNNIKYKNETKTFNKPISQIPISHNVTLFNNNVDTYAHFC